MSETNDIYQRLALQDTHVRAAYVTAAAAHALASRTDRDIAEVQAPLRAHTGVLNALRETQLQHGLQLADHSRQLTDHGRLLGEQRQLLAEHSQVLAEHSHVLAEHSQVLAEHSHVLAEHSQVLAEHSQQLFDVRTTQLEHGRQLTEIRAETRGGFASVDVRLESVDKRFDELSAKFDGLAELIARWGRSA